MERLTQLIGKLNEQFAEKVDPSQLLVTIKLIEAELVRQTAQQFEEVTTNHSRTGVAVVMPPGQVFMAPEPVSVKEEAEERSSYPVAESEPAVEYPDPEPTPAITDFDPLTEIPTLAHQQVVKELNESISQSASTTSSLNDRLKTDQLELAIKLNDAPVRDLKKAIGINERYIYINDLFRGDEAMFERSIKTINAFKILPEASYWIERELKVKLGWDETKPITQQFYQLVKRRFV